MRVIALVWGGLSATSASCFIFPMCGRYSLTTPAEAVRRLFGYPERPNLMPRVNIAPTQDVAAVRVAPDDEESKKGEPAGRHFAWLRWGLVPSWAKDVSIGARMINARAESVADKPAFRAAFRHRRCLIAADGFYEWKTEQGGRQPYRIALRDGGPYGFAGLWECWEKSPDGRPVESCTIITTDTNDLVRTIYTRMPVILDPADFEAWLDPRTPAADAQALLRPCPSEWLVAYRVSRAINKVGNDDLSLIEPIDDAPVEGRQQRLL